jgi:hypothetical protein
LVWGSCGLVDRCWVQVVRGSRVAWLCLGGGELRVLVMVRESVVVWGGSGEVSVPVIAR